MDVYIDSPYYPDRNGVSVTTTYGDPAIAKVRIPYYDRNNGAYINTFEDNVICNASGSYN